MENLNVSRYCLNSECKPDNKFDNHVDKPITNEEYTSIAIIICKSVLSNKHQ